MQPEAESPVADGVHDEAAGESVHARVVPVLPVDGHRVLDDTRRVVAEVVASSQLNAHSFSCGHVTVRFRRTALKLISLCMHAVGGDVVGCLTVPRDSKNDFFGTSDQETAFVRNTNLVWLLWQNRRSTKIVGWQDTLQVSPLRSQNWGSELGRSRTDPSALGAEATLGVSLLEE